MASGRETARGQLASGQRDRALVFVYLVAPVEDEAARVKHHDREAKAGAGVLLADNRLDEARDAGAGRTRAHENEPLGGQRLAAHPQRGQQPGDDDRGGALDVIVEARDAVAVAVEQPDGGVCLKSSHCSTAAG